MRKVENDIRKNPRFILKSDINKGTLKELGLTGMVSVSQLKKEFVDCPYGFTTMMGNPYNENQQKHVKVVDKQGLRDWVIKGDIRRNKR